MEDSSKLILVLTLILCIVILFFTYDTNKKVETLQKENAALWEQLGVIPNIEPVRRDSTSTTETATSEQSERSSFFKELFGKKESDEATEKEKSEKTSFFEEFFGETTRMTVSSSYRIEDRFTNRVERPEILSDEEGTVVVDIVVDWMGNVTKTSINKASTLNDEIVLDAARKAALKTRFNFASSTQQSQRGTITYTYHME